MHNCSCHVINSNMEFCWVFKLYRRQQWWFDIWALVFHFCIICTYLFWSFFMWPLFCEGLNLISTLFLLPWLPLHPSLPPSLQALCCPSWQLATSTSDSAWGWDKLKHDWMELKQFLKGETVQLHQKKEMNTRWANITLKNCIHNTIVCQARIKDVFLFPFVLLLNGFPCSKKKKKLLIHHVETLAGVLMVVMVVLLVLPNSEGSRESNGNQMDAWMAPSSFTSTKQEMELRPIIHAARSFRNLSLHVYDSLVFDLLGEMCMRFFCVCVCMYVIRYVGCWPLKTANKVCSLSLVCVRKMGPAKWVCVHVCFGVGEFDCVCVN